MEGKEEVKGKPEVPRLGNWVNDSAINWEREYKGKSCNRRNIFFYVDFKGEVERERDILHSYQIIKITGD